MLATGAAMAVNPKTGRTKYEMKEVTPQVERSGVGIDLPGISESQQGQLCQPFIQRTQINCVQVSGSLRQMDIADKCGV
eukprot:Em0007g658a